MTARGCHCDPLRTRRRRHSTPGGGSCCVTRSQPLGGLSTPCRRRGLTLVELLITVTIMAIIAAAILGTAAAALDSARASRTESIILRLHTLLMERWDTYQTRRVDIDPSLLQDMEARLASSGLAPAAQNLARGQILADMRLLALRELMKLEMPDRWSDVVMPPTQGRPYVLGSVPALTNVYHRQLMSLPEDDDDVVRRFQGAECLYMVIMNATGDGEARTMFAEQDIGDVDGDGAPEFLDGWGRPISWVRWPAGFVSDVQPLIFDPDLNKEVRAPSIDPDPFDLYRRDQDTVTNRPMKQYPVLPGKNIGQMVLAMQNRGKQMGGAYRIVPLIYSAGPDSISDIHTNQDHVDTLLDPYRYTSNSDPQRQLGQPYDEDDDGDDNSLDNIHNHLIEF